jgi:hypothetical protein
LTSAAADILATLDLVAELLSCLIEKAPVTNPVHLRLPYGQNFATLFEHV